ncbi:hypothetical protein C4D60_Mb09t14560 [Musa balbisiana]|uniref:Nuclear condensin complex subunit 3 C-terminal domain-containing protein n=1 Tax=Musa balbisiana TaxID=52838 RepID=A0A4S8IGI9_MUSBA|nr:hypothetical protein C4D60_Mb09t14560 [Musa balbisiana]
MAEEERRLAGEIGRVLDECRLSHAVHPRKLKELSALRSASAADAHPGLCFFAAFTRAVTPLFDFPRRTVSSERAVRFVSAFAARRDEKDAVVCDAFLEEFLRFLLVAAAAAHRPARFRACQIISEIIMRLPDDAEVSDELWDEVIDSMKQRVGDKVPAVRAFAVRALSRFVNDGDDSDITNLFLQTLCQEQNTEVRKTIVLSLPPSNMTSEAIVGSTLDVSESVRKAAYLVLASKFPLHSLSIKHRTIILQRGLSDRSSSVRKECMKMLKDEWLAKCCSGDLIALMRFLDVETYESVGEAIMEALFKDGTIILKEYQSPRQFFASNCENTEGCTSNIQLMEAEAALYWKILCRHLQSEAEAKGNDAATTTGTEAAIYASEASDKNDLLDEILPATVSDFVSLVKVHLSAGPNYCFTSRQLLLFGAMLDYSDVANRKVASEFVNELLLRPLEHEVDDDGNKIVIGDGISLGGDREWARAILELAKKVHASMGEFEAVVTSVIKELAQPCRERTADFMQWMHCLALTGLLLENIPSLWSLQGKAIEPSELLHSLLLPGAKHSHIDVQRVATRCLSLFGILERRPTGELVSQLRQSFIDGATSVRIMASKSLIDLLTWHGPQEVDKAIGIDFKQPNNEKEGLVSINSSNLRDDESIGLLDLLYNGLNSDDSGEVGDAADDESVHSILGEGFAKILLLSENYPSISTCLSPLILHKLINLYFCDETKELQRLKQCLSIFFEHYPALSCTHKASNGYYEVYLYFFYSYHAILVAWCLWKEDELISGNLSSSVQTSDDFDSGEEGIAIRIAAEVAGCPEKKTSAGKSYILALCRIAASINFRPSEQHAIKCMRGLLNGMITSVTRDKELVKELNLMAARLRSLDEHPDEGLSEDQSTALFGKLGLEGNLNIDTSTVIPPTPAPQSGRTATTRRRRVRREVSSSDDDAQSVPLVPMTPSQTNVRSHRTSKTAAMSKITNKTAVESSDDEDGESDVTSDEFSE